MSIVNRDVRKWDHSFNNDEKLGQSYTSSFFRMYVPPVYRRTTFRRERLIYSIEQFFVCKKLFNPCGRESSFHSVRLLGHNRTSKSVKVPIFPLALNATVAGYMTAQTTFKVLSFLAGCLQFEQTLYTLLTSSSLSSLSMVSRNSRRIACSFNRSGSAAGLGVGFSEDTRSLLHTFS